MIIKTGLVYRNARGDEFDFDARGVYARPDPLMDWEYGVSELNGALAAYRRDPKDLEFECTMGDPGLLRRQMDDLYEVAAYDLANNLQGTLAVRGWEARASLVKSEKAGWWLPSGPVSYTLTGSSPRLRGALISSLMGILPSGSSPRLRGARFRRSRHRRGAGIIPALAGSTRC